MTNNTYLLPVIDTIKLSWSKVYGAKGSFWIAFLVMFVITFCLGFVDGIFKALFPSVEPVVAFIMEVVAFLLQMGLLYIGIVRAQDLPVSWNLMFRAFESQITLRVIGLYLLQIIIMIIPMILIFIGFVIYTLHFIGAVAISVLLFTLGAIGVIVLAVRMMLSMSFVLDKGIGPIAALKQSFNATRSNFWRMIAVFILQSLIVIISAIPLGIGLIWTLPFSFIVYGAMYRSLSLNNTRA